MYSQFTKNNVLCTLCSPGTVLSEKADAIVMDHRHIISTSPEEWKKSLSSKILCMLPGSFLVVLLPGENADNYETLYKFKCMAIGSGFRYYASVPCDRDNTLIDKHRFCDSDTVLFLSAGVHDTDTLKWLPGRFNISDARCGSKYYVADHSDELYTDIIERIVAREATVLFDFAGCGIPGISAFMTGRNSILLSDSMNEYVRAYDILSSCSILKGVVALN